MLTFPRAGRAMRIGRLTAAALASLLAAVVTAGPALSATGSHAVAGHAVALRPADTGWDGLAR